ncbi:MAG: hypothetical protein EOP11_03925 [Proteobacteria bacterium]|nr:MAG: hypothetical protein EOP11_03925 [Pseudomonadota bacterium]
MELLLIGKANISAGWLTMVLGILSGAVIGMWAFAGPFPTPPGHRDYADLSRRMVRLGHIALIALPLINIVYGWHIDSIPLSHDIKVLGSRCMIVCMVGVPLFLFLGSVWHWFKYIEVIPVSAGFLGLAIMSYGHFLML